MPPAKRRVVAVQPQEVLPVQAAPAPQRRVGRPPGEASTIVRRCSKGVDVLSSVSVSEVH